MSDGSIKHIENIHVGDKVLSRDVKTGQVSEQRVERVFAQEAHPLLHLSLASGEMILTTPDHPFYQEGVGFVSAKRLAADAHLLSASSAPHNLVSVQSSQLLSGAVKVYNFEVSHTHTYFVGQSHVLVHNRFW